LLHTLLLSFGFGLITASILAIAAVGLSLQFGITNYINFAYGDLLTFGVYTAFVVN
jgi:branched-subunit amino acid ABC-type transport system permease component